MKHLKIFENFNIDIKNFCEEYGIKKYSINKDGSIDVDSDINLFNKNLNKIPIKFNKVYGDFDCANNKLTTLENSPKWVGGWFNCSHNILETLENSPVNIKDFNCCYNKLITLIKGPQKVHGFYQCSSNNLKDVYGFPENYFFPKDYINYLLDNDAPLDTVHSLSMFVENNPVEEIINLVSYDKKYSFVKILNEFRVIRDGDTVIESRLFDALSEVGIKTFPENLKFKNYKLI